MIIILHVKGFYKTLTSKGPFLDLILQLFAVIIQKIQRKADKQHQTA
jgi:hypothetical protein